MISPLLATKLHQPYLPSRYIQRPFLTQQLNEGLASGSRLTLVSAPAGFGKSTCIIAWLAGQERPAAWLSLDPADDDPARFFSYFLAALQKIDGNIGREIENALQSGQLPPLELLMVALVNDTLKMNRKFFLVLDDFQVIHDAAVLKSLEILLNKQPENMHLILVTREDPPLPLARLRANHQMTEIRAGDLRFSVAETGRFLSEVMALYLTETDTAALTERTEGWVVGLQLAGLSMRGRADSSSFIASLSGSHRYILSYLTEEVLNDQPQEIQAFLLQTSIMEQLSGNLCDTLTGRADSSALLERLFSANLFLISLDDVGQWYRYHHLFADLLQAHLRQISPVEQITMLHQRAAGWFEQHGFANEAVQHALAAGDFESLARLIEQNASAMITRGELATIMRWTEALPGEWLRDHPQILIAKAWALTLAGAVRQVEPLLQQAEAQIKSEGDTPSARELLGNAAAIRAFFAMLAAGYPQALELAGRAEELLPQSSTQARSMLPYTLGASYRGQGDYEKAIEAFSRLAQMGELNGDLITWATGMTEVVNTRRMQGRLREANETCRQALQKMTARGAFQFGSLAKLEVALAEVLREQNELEEAYRRVTGVMARMQAWTMPTDRIFAGLVLIHVQMAQGNYPAALETLREAKELKTAFPVLMPLACLVDQDEIRLSLATGDISTAARLVTDLQPGANRVASLREQELLLLVRVRLAQGRVEEAGQILDSLAGSKGETGRLGFRIEKLVLRALLLNQCGEQAAAAARLLEALALAEPEGFARVFIDEGMSMRSLLAVAAGQAPAVLSAFIQKLLGAFSGEPELFQIQEKNADLAEPLTERELEVLGLIAEGLKYEEIAGRLFISVNTVRTYVKAIYGKLNVNNRSKAIAAANRLKILQG